MHDMWYRYGFTEAAGNFQENNYGRGGLASDYVNAEAQDGGGTNNAKLATPNDGTNPRMQMYLWTGGGGGATNLLTVNSPSSISGVYTATQAAFGPGVPSTPITADLVLAVAGERLCQGGRFLKEPLGADLGRLLRLPPWLPSVGRGPQRLPPGKLRASECKRIDYAGARYEPGVTKKENGMYRNCWAKCVLGDLHDASGIGKG